MKRSRMLSIFTLAAIAFVAASCATYTVRYDYDSEVRFEELETFGWMPSPAGGAEVTDLTVKRVRAAVENELAEKGYSPDARNPDFLIAIRGGKEKRVDVVDWGYTYRGYDHDNYGYYHPHHRIDFYQYEEGTLILDFVDAGSRELIWRGTVTRVIDPNATRKKRVQMVNEAVGKVLETFPPPE